MSPPIVVVGGRVGGGCGGDDPTDLAIGPTLPRRRRRLLSPRPKTTVHSWHLAPRRRPRRFAIVVLTTLLLVILVRPPSPPDDGHGCRRCLVAVAFSAGGGAYRRAGGGGGFGGGSSGGSGGKRSSGRRKKNGSGRRDGGRRGGGGFFNPETVGGGVERRTIQLGGGRAVDVYVPPDRLEMELGMEESNSSEPTAPSKRTRDEMLDAYGSFYGTGDVLWPSSLRLASLLANCPSFSDGRDVLEIGCGLGLCSASVARYNNAKTLTLCDVDGEVLDLAVRTCEEILNERRKSKDFEMEVATRVDRCQLDWNDESTWPPERGGGVDLVVGSDVLYSEGAVGPLARLLAFLLVEDGCGADDKEVEGGDDEVESQEDALMRRALLVDPANRLHRDAFAESCRGCGLSAETVPFPGGGGDDFVLISVTPCEH